MKIEIQRRGVIRSPDELFAAAIQDRDIFRGDEPGDEQTRVRISFVVREYEEEESPISLDWELSIRIRIGIEGSPECCRRAFMDPDYHPPEESVSWGLLFCQRCEDSSCGSGTIREAVRGFSFLCTRCCACSCGGIFRFRRGICRHTLTAMMCLLSLGVSRDMRRLICQLASEPVGFC